MDDNSPDSKPISLVTGGAGFIGAHVVNYLVDHLKHNVVALDDLSGGFEDNVHPQATFVRGSVTDHALIDSLFSKYRFDYVYHLAAYAAEGLSHFIRRFNYTNNLIGSTNLINASVNFGVKCFVFTSSIAVYGSLPPPMKEDNTPQPEDPYGIAKYAVEMDLKAAKEMFGLDYVIFRPHNVYGEYQNIGDRYRNVIGIFMNQILKGKPLTVFGDGSQTRAFSYISDVAPYIARAPLVEAAINQIINIGGDQEYSVLELTHAVAEVMHEKPDIRHLTERNEVVHARADHTKAKEIFGINDDRFVNLLDGLTKTAEWVRSHGSRKTPRFGDIEVVKNIPPIWLED